jgi:NitT/TauT family transport system substrate-binding protein
VPGLATLWDKTVGTAHEVRALCAAQAMPFILVTNRPEIKSIKDFKEGHKIAVPGVKNSNQAICLQMAAAKEWGQANYAQLDPFTITLPHPDGRDRDHLALDRARRTLRRRAVPELRARGARHARGAEVLRHARRPDHQRRRADDEEIPRRQSEGDERGLCGARRGVGDYQQGAAPERRSLHPHDQREALGPDEMAKMISDPDNAWTTTPQNAMRYVEFMHKVGTLKKLPADWKDMFMPECTS